MEKQVVFVDIDGTLVNDDQSIPPSSIIAISEARKSGHRVYMCTGRSLPEVYQDLWDIGFDGLIGAGGAYIQNGDEVLLHQRMDPHVLKDTLAYLDENGFDYYIESNSGLYGSKHCHEHIAASLGLPMDEAMKNPFMKAIQIKDDVDLSNVNKLCFMESAGIDFQTVYERFHADYEVLHCTIPAFGAQSGELAIKGVSKSNAIAQLLKALDWQAANTVAFGDGNNDIDMFNYCNYGVAMGNATKELKAVADYVTTDVGEDGLYHGFIQVGLM